MRLQSTPAWGPIKCFSLDSASGNTGNCYLYRLECLLLAHHFSSSLQTVFYSVNDPPADEMTLGPKIHIYNTLIRVFSPGGRLGCSLILGVL